MCVFKIAGCKTGIVEWSEVMIFASSNDYKRKYFSVQDRSNLFPFFSFQGEGVAPAYTKASVPDSPGIWPSPVLEGPMVEYTADRGLKSK